MKKNKSDSVFLFGVLLIIYGLILRFTPTNKAEDAILVYVIILVGIMIWCTIGYFVVLLIDDENNSLAKWVNDAPLGLSLFIPAFFPIFLFYHVKNKRNST